MTQNKSGRIYDDPDDSIRPVSAVKTALFILLGMLMFIGLAFYLPLFLAIAFFGLGYGGCAYLHLSLKAKPNTAGMRAHIVTLEMLVIDVLAFFVMLSVGFGAKITVVVTSWFAIGVVIYGLQQWHARRSYLNR